MNITKNKLLKKYKKSVNRIADDCDWKTYFTSQEVCGIVYRILSKNDENIINLITVEKLHDIYTSKIDSMNLIDDEWQKNYGINEIIDIIYVLLINLEHQETLN